MRAHRARGFMGLLASYIQENSETRQGTRGQVKNPSKGVPKGQKKAALQIPVFFLGLSLYLAFFLCLGFFLAHAPRASPREARGQYYRLLRSTTADTHAHHVARCTRARAHINIIVLKYISKIYPGGGKRTQSSKHTPRAHHNHMERCDERSRARGWL